MTIMQTITILLLSIGMLVMTMALIRCQMLREKYALTWILISMAMLSVPVCYDFYIFIARFLGIIDPVSFFFLTAIIALFLLSLQFSIALTFSFRQRKILMQQLAIIEQKVQDLERIKFP